jgi:CheY-like chemotaxis protein
MSDLNLVLCIEDDPNIQAMVKFSLEATREFAVLTCGNGQAAFNLVSSCSFDLILLDLKMPGLDGLIIYKILRSMEQTAQIPIIFLTANIPSYEVEKYQQIGALGVIFKPFDPLTLPQNVADIWQKAYPQRC